MTTENDVRQYYDAFVMRLKQDHAHENPRHRKIKEGLDRLQLDGKTVLDIGCGTGITSRYIAERGAKRVVAVDLSPVLIDFAREHSWNAVIEYRAENALTMSLDEQFDIIVFAACFEHFPRHEIERVRRLIKRHEKPGTLIFLNIPDGRYQDRVRKTRPQLMQIIDESYSLEWLVRFFDLAGYTPFRIDMYGLDVPAPQYTSVIFVQETALNEFYGG
jgi:2-polyprenyl-3-methyl-5-hydroxy-6-metoxy-1,4-benzoquinol methylase